MGRYEVLSLDDFYFGAMTHNAWITTHSIREVFKAACEQVEFYFYAKQATYSSVFLMSFFPGVWDINLYFPVPFILSSMIIGSITALVHTVVSDCMGVKDKYLTGIMNMILIFTVIQTLPVPLEAIFWFNGSLHYAFMESVLFFEIALILHGMHSDRTKIRVMTIVVASLLGIVVGGGNLITGLQACILMGIHILVIVCGQFAAKKDNGLFAKLGLSGYKREKIIFLIPEFITFIGYMINITAPGNAQRQAASVQMTPVKAIFESFLWGITHAVSWLSPMTVFGVMLIIPVAAYISSKTKKQYLHPIFMGIISICVFAAMFTPTFYAMSEDVPSRIANIVYIAEFVIIFINICNDLGYLYSVSRSKEGLANFLKNLFELTGNSLNKTIAFFAVMIIIIFVFCADKNEFVTISAVRSILNGEASRYYEQSMERLEILSDETQSDVTIRAYTEDAKPYLLFKEEVGNIPGEEGYWQNIELSNYFNKNSITVVSP
ncbi:MAG: hypothetical protein K6G12_01865 [Lachnospiraceae bacterium]|nr:hypothetical protein [Lachnospiraceae bacterium]